MIVKTDNQTANYNHHLARDIRATVRELTDERKQELLNEIQIRKGVNYLTNKEYDLQTCEYIESLLNGKQPKNGLSHK